MQWKQNKICQCEIYFEEAYFEEVTTFEKIENKNFKNNRYMVAPHQSFSIYLLHFNHSSRYIY